MRDAPEEIIVVLNRHIAREGGFRGHTHPQLPHVRVWWPGADTAQLMQARPQRVTIDSSCRQAHRDPSLHRLLAAGLRALRTGGHVHGDRFVWLEF
jgi:hypothetical protein